MVTRERARMHKKPSMIRGHHVYKSIWTLIWINIELVSCRFLGLPFSNVYGFQLKGNVVALSLLCHSPSHVTEFTMYNRLEHVQCVCGQMPHLQDWTRHLIEVQRLLAWQPGLPPVLIQGWRLFRGGLLFKEIQYLIQNHEQEQAQELIHKTVRLYT